MSPAKAEPETNLDMQVFNKKLQVCKKDIDRQIKTYCAAVRQSTLKNYGAQARLVTDAYLSILERGGKRIRGALVMIGYEMLGGSDKKMILQAALAIEMINAYILIIDDIQDRSMVRRGGPTAHIELANYHRNHHLAEDSDHFGVAVALNAAIAGNHAAQMLLANLGASEDARLKVLSVLNRTMLVTAHGQTGDLFNEVSGNVTEQDIEQVEEWKTANYTILNPLHVGMILAGADCRATDAITDYSMHTGKAFQITDDIVGLFGDEGKSGKNPLDDIKEGKRTILTVYALKKSPSADQNFLLHMLGNSNLTRVEFERCKEIIVSSGALDYARQKAAAHVEAAVQAVNREAELWSASGTQFLRGLARYLLSRTA